MKLTAQRRETLTALGFLAPNFIGFFLFVAFPVLFSAVIVLTNWSLKPAVETRFLGLNNIWRLVGFRPVEGVAASEVGVWFVLYFGSFAAMIAGVFLSFLGLGRKWRGNRLGGLVGILGGAGVFVAAIGGLLGVGSALLGVTLIFGFLFFLGDEDSDWSLSKGALGAVLLVAGLALVLALQKPFLERWEPLDPLFWKYFYNTLYLMFAIPVSIAGSLGLALILSQPLLKARTRNKTVLTLGMLVLGVIGAVTSWMAGHPDLGVFWAVFWLIAAMGIGLGVVAFRTLFYLPSFTAGIAVMLLWKHMFNPTFGPINEGVRIVFSVFGIPVTPPEWLTDPNWAKPALMLMNFWIQVGGGNMLLYLAGLSNIPVELYEAASIDGAGRWQRFWNVTWPQLAPTTFFIIIISTIAGLQGGFEQARVMTEGGPAGSTKTLAYYVYERAFQELSLGYGSAIAWVLFVFVFVLTMFNWRFGNRYVNY